MQDGSGFRGLLGRIFDIFVYFFAYPKCIKMKFSCGSGAIFRLFGDMMLEEKLKLEKCGFGGLKTRVLEAKLACFWQFWAGFGAEVLGCIFEAGRTP